MWQVRDDAIVKNPQDAQHTFDLPGTQNKELYWIEGTTKRFEDSYNWFGRTLRRGYHFLPNTWVEPFHERGLLNRSK